MNGKVTYKSSRKYQCPYCDKKLTRADLVDHIAKKHEDMIPENYSALRVVYEAINKKNYNTCMICGKKVYEWNDKVGRYNNLCDNPACRKKVTEIAQGRLMKVYNRPNLLKDNPEHQEKMLASRKISSKYTHTDGTVFTCTGSYEKKAIEFLDKGLNIPGKDIMMPGPVLEYEFNGVKHHWITDIYYIPANLVIEVKDGGSNPNKRNMPEYRGKQVAKEEMITKLGKFNYLRLTDNNFAQILDAMADIKYHIMEDKENTTYYSIKINEEVNGFPPANAGNVYITPILMNSVFSGNDREEIRCGISTNTSNDVIFPSENGLKKVPKKIVENITKTYFVYTGNDKEEAMTRLNESITAAKSSKNITPLYFCEALLGRKLRSWEEVLLSEAMKMVDRERLMLRDTFIYNGIQKKAYELSHPDSISEVYLGSSENVDNNGYVTIVSTDKGYFAHTPDDFYLATDFYSNKESIPDSIIKLLNDIYTARVEVKE